MLTDSSVVQYVVFGEDRNDFVDGFGEVYV